MKNLALILLLAAILSPAAFGQDAEKERDLRRLLELNGFSEQVHLLTETLSESVVEWVRQQASPSEADVVEIFERFQTEFQARYAKAAPELVLPIYDKHFTHEEVRTLIQFLESPIGQRMRELTPQISQEAEAAGELVAEQLAAEVLDELKAELVRESFTPNTSAAPEAMTIAGKFTLGQTFNLKITKTRSDAGSSGPMGSTTSAVVRVLEADHHGFLMEWTFGATNVASSPRRSDSAIELTSNLDGVRLESCWIRKASLLAFRMKQLHW